MFDVDGGCGGHLFCLFSRREGDLDIGVENAIYFADGIGELFGEALLVADFILQVGGDEALVTEEAEEGSSADAWEAGLVEDGERFGDVAGVDVDIPHLLGRASSDGARGSGCFICGDPFRGKEDDDFVGIAFRDIVDDRCFGTAADEEEQTE